MTHITCRLTAKNRDQLRNPTLGNRVWATLNFLHWSSVFYVAVCLRRSGRRRKFRCRLEHAKAAGSVVRWRHRGRCDVIEAGGIQDGGARGGGTIARGSGGRQPVLVRAREEVADYNPHVERHRCSTSDYSALHRTWNLYVKKTTTAEIWATD